MGFEFNPGDRNSRIMLQRASRSSLRELFRKEYPPGMLDTLPIGTRMMLYDFEYRPDHSGVGLIVCVDVDDRIVGWLHKDYSVYPPHGNSLLELPEGAIGFERAREP